MAQLNNIELTALQTDAINLLKSKDNVFISGPAGTGKSFLINHYISNYSPRTPIVASTGMAAILVGGQTFHSFFGLGRMDLNDSVIIENAKKFFPLVRRISKTRELILDEVSMLPGKAFTLADKICQAVKGNSLPFGGIRVIITGDFFQLPPVIINGPSDWVFNTPTWKNLKMTPILLEEILRTKDEEFLKVLQSVRNGEITENVKDFLNKRTLPREKFQDFVGTRIFSRTKSVEEYNKLKFDEIKSEEITLKTTYTGSSENILRLKKNLIIGDNVKIKIGAFVMVRVNNQKKGYINGTLGHMSDHDHLFLKIKTLGGRFIYVEKHTFELKNGDGNVVATATNFPISLAYAITIHKSQGASIDVALMDIRKLWESGQAYTALSRLKSGDGLHLVGWDEKSIRVSPEVIDFYKNLKR